MARCGKVIKKAQIRGFDRLARSNLASRMKAARADLRYKNRSGIASESKLFAPFVICSASILSFRQSTIKGGTLFFDDDILQSPYRFVGAMKLIDAIKTSKPSELSKESALSTMEVQLIPNYSLKMLLSLCLNP